MFQSPRSRGRTRQDMYFTIPEQVSIPAVSREDATTLISPVSSLPCFNPLVLAGGRDITNWQRDNARGFQSTRPRGRTRQDFGYRNSAEISFNPRVLAGGRDGAGDADAFAADVSIHASSREDATYSFFCSLTYWQFQSTRPRGRTRPVVAAALVMIRKFQSTRPRGRTRLTRLIIKPPNLCFNPRILPRGRDMGKGGSTPSYQVSIHASSREDATNLIWNEWFRDEFQSTRPRGRTRHRYKCRPGHSDCFNPRALAISRSRNLALSQSRNLALSRSRNLVLSQSRNLAISQSRALAISQSRNLAISQSRALAISQSRNLAISQ